VQATENAEYSRLFPAERWARVRIALRDGRVLESAPAQPRGDLASPLSDDELRAKYVALAEPVLGRARAERIERLVGELRNGGALTELMDELLEAP
jgi:2-methylcitrate dehydratase PrpD